MPQFKWNQPELAPDDMGMGAIAQQLFEGKKQIPADIFVREDLQNRVDARVEESNDPVRVSIVQRSLPGHLIQKYFPDAFQDFLIRTSTMAQQEEESERTRKKLMDIFQSTEFPVLIIEDFNTTGLNGPVNSHIPESNVKSPLFHPTNALTCFFRRNGLSGKTGKKLGSAGLGRHVYYKASEISTKFVYTVPSDLCREETDSLANVPVSPLFFGQSFQRELAERVDGKQRRYSAYQNLSAGELGELPMPFGLDADEAAFVEQARRDFRLTRQPTEPGCSLIIPFPKKKLTLESIIEAIAKDFAMPIIEGLLVVKVGDVEINAQEIATLTGKPDVNQHNTFLADTLEQEPDTKIEVAYDRLVSGVFDSDLIGESDVADMAVKFNDGDLVAADMNIHFGSRPDQQGTVRIAAQLIPDELKGRHIVARSGLLLSEHSDKRFNRRTNALVLVSADQLGNVLRSSENPAHSKWLPGDIDEYVCAEPEKLVQFITHAHQALERILTNLESEDDLTIFSDLLPTGKKKVDQKPPPFQMSLRDDMQTLAVTVSPEYDADPNSAWRMILVYDSFLGSGRARKGHRPDTFNLTEVKSSISGGRITSTGVCYLDVIIDDAASFDLIIGPCGFEGWPDLRVSAQQIAQPKESQA